MDAIALTALLTAIGSMAVSILTHIKHSKCYGIDITTTESHTPTIQTQEEHFNYGSMIESVSRPPSPNHLKVSNPIPIPIPDEKITKYNTL
jgi:hypothetical protein